MSVVSKQNLSNCRATTKKDEGAPSRDCGARKTRPFRARGTRKSAESFGRNDEPIQSWERMSSPIFAKRPAIFPPLRTVVRSGGRAYFPSVVWSDLRWFAPSPSLNGLAGGAPPPPPIPPPPALG